MGSGPETLNWTIFMASVSLARVDIYTWNTVILKASDEITNYVEIEMKTCTV